ncbi:hypothetical protein [Paenibacillus massiliensis]|uniref:hypothetical protein n=1 Tax=Paenibacillus massiliensis TaxID=225917 RepID=UPI0003750A1E|nr:hypothetical protein [Paenibacillus massiliensis]
MKLRIVPIALAAVLSASVLFGGWFLYRQVAVHQPLQKIVTQYPGVTSAQVDINQSEVTLKLDLEPDTDVRGLVQAVKEDGSSVLGSKRLKLDIKDHSDQELDKLWSQAMFPIAEAMDSKRYTDIPATINGLQQGEIKADTNMDDANVYIRLQNGEASKYIILPRESQKIGVWPNA